MNIENLCRLTLSCRGVVSENTPPTHPPSVEVADIDAGEVKCSIPKPKTRYLQFSPLGTYLALWEPYAGKAGAQVCVCVCVCGVHGLYTVIFVLKCFESCQ